MSNKVKAFKKNENNKVDAYIKEEKVLLKKLAIVRAKKKKAEERKIKVNKITKIKLGNHDQPIPDSGNFDPEFSFLISGSETSTKERYLEMSTLYDSEFFNDPDESLSVNEIVKIIKDRTNRCTSKVHLFYDSGEKEKPKRAVKTICDTLNGDNTFVCDINSLYTKNFEPDNI